MSGNSDTNTSKDAGEVDPSSFASILAGVKRMREEYGAGGDRASSDGVGKEQTGAQHEYSPESIKKQKPSTEITTARHVLESQSKSIIDVAALRTTLDKPTAKPVPPTPSSHGQQRQISNRTSSHEPSLTQNKSVASPINDVAPRSARQRQQSSRPIGPAEILVHKSQEKNPLLSDSMMKTTPWVFDSLILSDYYINPTFQILFLSLKYHKLRPEYIWTRLKKLNKGSSVIENRNDKVLRVLLVVVDIDSHQEPLRKLSDFCIKHDLSLMLAWSFEEAGNYIALGKHFDNAPQKSKDSIKGFRGADYNSSVVEAFTTVKAVNKTDVSNLLANYKSVKEIILQCCRDEEGFGAGAATSSNNKNSNTNVGLANIAGLGSVKCQNLKQMFLEPFIFNKNYDNK